MNQNNFQMIFSQIPQERRDLLFVSDLSEMHLGFINRGQIEKPYSSERINQPLELFSLEIKILYYKICDDLKSRLSKNENIMEWSKNDPSNFEIWKNKNKLDLIKIQNEFKKNNLPYLEIVFDENKTRESEKINLDDDSDETELPEEDEEFTEKWTELPEILIIEPSRKIEEFEWQNQTIFSNFKIIDSVPKEDVPKSDYSIRPYLIYRNLPPENRFKYLFWLKDISQPIDRHYVYMYLECLEHRGIYNDTEPVIKEITLIMKFHSEKTIQNRCSVALNNICFYREQLEKLFSIYKSDKLISMSNPLLVFFIQKNIDLEASDIFSIFKSLKFKLSIAKGMEEHYLKAIELVLEKRFKERKMPFGSIYSYHDVPKVKSNFINNFNLNTEINYVRVPEVWYLSDFNEKLNEIYLESYSIFKSNKKQN